MHGDYNRQKVELSTIALMIYDLTDRSIGFSPRSARLTIQKISERVTHEGVSFLTKTLPKLGKAFDKGLVNETLVLPPEFERIQGTELPKLFGELFALVFDSLGRIIPSANPNVVRIIRELTYLFYKYEIPCEQSLNDNAIEAFVQTDDKIPEILNSDSYMDFITGKDGVLPTCRGLLHLLFDGYDLGAFTPRQGPGAVARREKYAAKFTWEYIPLRTAQVFGPEYFYPDWDRRIKEFADLKSDEIPTRVVTVPKDSRGPRVISAEPKELIWLQLGVMGRIYDLVESHPLTRGYVNFRDQSINGRLALVSSKTQEWATLDLAEASDRVPLHLVEAIFPEDVLRYLLAARSKYTMVPTGRVLKLNKFAPMGSALCFPVLALVTWAVLRAHGLTCYVYGDDIIVKRGETQLAIDALTRVGLKVNKDKCCSEGFFRESCGIDAYKGIDVSPVRIRTVWESRRSPAVYASWLSYANSLYLRGYLRCADAIALGLEAIYGPIHRDNSCSGLTPSLYFGDESLNKRLECKYSKRYQRLRYRVTSTRNLTLEGFRDDLNYRRSLSGIDDKDDRLEHLPFWSKNQRVSDVRIFSLIGVKPPSDSAGVYTDRRMSKLIYRWI